MRLSRCNTYAHSYITISYIVPVIFISANIRKNDMDVDNGQQLIHGAGDSQTERILLEVTDD